MNSWDSAQYLKFKKERTQPAIDLAGRISVEQPARIVDIGCGPGNSTAVLKRFFPDAYVLGVDNSEDMIHSAKKTYPALAFSLFDATQEFSVWEQKFDIVFSNACIQWIPDHPRLLKKMWGLLNENGQMAIQVPMNQHEPIHQIIKEITTSRKWADKFCKPRVFYTLSPEDYFDLLSSLTPDFCMWETSYFHRMSSHQSILEWYRGTGLRPYLSVLNEADKRAFEEEILHEVAGRYPVQTNGEVIFRFPRLFFTARR